MFLIQPKDTKHFDSREEEKTINWLCYLSICCGGYGALSIAADGRRYKIGIGLEGDSGGWKGELLCNSTSGVSVAVC